MPLPSHIVEGEHFVIADLWCLVSGSASSSRNPVIEASSRVQGAGSTSRPSASSSGGSSSSPPALGQRTRSSRPERLLLPEQVTRPAPPPPPPPPPPPHPPRASGKGQVEKGRRNAPGFKGEDFVPWVSVDTVGLQDF